MYLREQCSLIFCFIQLDYLLTAKCFKVKSSSCQHVLLCKLTERRWDVKNVLAFGDSNTWGLIPGTKDRFPWGIRWTSIIQENLEGVRVIEEGLCGRTTVFEDELRPLRKAIDVLPMVLETITPIDYAIVMLGTNDCKALFHNNAYTIISGLKLCVSEIGKYLPPDKILIVSPIYLGEDVWREDKDPEFDKDSVKVSTKLKKYYKEFALENGYSFLAASDYAKASHIDEEHLDEEGHRNLSKAIIEKISPFLL